MYMWFSALMFMCGFLVVCLCGKSLILILLGLEIVSLSLLLAVLMIGLKNCYLLGMCLMVMSVAEASVILCYVVVVMRLFGHDKASLVSMTCVS